MFGHRKDFVTSILERSRQLRRRTGEVVSRAGAAVASEFGREELYLAAALGLIALGCWDLWRPGSFLVPGAVLLWVGLPTRSGFIERPSNAVKKG